MRLETNQTDEGVSPVVGVILMVAITVILSAIIATFVLDLGGTVSQNPSAGVTFDQECSGSGADACTVSIQIVSMENADSVSATGTDNAGGTALAQSDGDTAVDGSDSTSNVSDIDTFENAGDGDKVTVTATLEGKTSVIQTYTVDN